MKILFVVSSLSAGGAERVLTLLANRWSAHHDVAVVTLKGTGSDFFTLDTQVRRFALGVTRRRWWMPLPYLRLLWSLRRLLRSERPDFVISLVIKTNIFTLLSALGLRLRVVACEHSVIDRDDIDGRQNVLRGLLYRSALRVGVLSDSIREEFIRKYPRVDSRRLVVIPNPVEAQRAGQPAGRSIAADFEKDRREIDLVLAIGRLVPSKGYNSLIEAFALVHKRNHRARLVIFGEGPERARLEGTVSRLGLVNLVKLPGQTGMPLEALTQADVFVMSSSFEGFPMALVEAFSTGLAVAAYAAPGVSELIVDGRNGLLAPQGDAAALAAAIQRLLEDRELCRRLGGAAREVAARYGPDEIDRVWFQQVLVP